MTDASKTGGAAATVDAKARTPRKTTAAPRKASGRAPTGASPRKPAAKASPVAAAKKAKLAKPAPPKTVKAVKVAKAAPAKARAKLVRDSFTMPQSDFDLIAALKARALEFGRPTKKSELLRAGLQVLAGASNAQLGAALEALVPLKPGRPKKG